MQPHEVLNLPSEGFSVEQLRYNYKVLARQLHPDKRHGRMTAEQATEMFQVLTAAYRALLARMEGRGGGPDRTHHDLREQARRHYDSAPGPSMGDDGGGRRRGFDAAKFNSVFADNRVPDPVVDGGYGRWMVDNDPEATQRQMHGAHQLARVAEPAPVSVSRRSCVAFSELGAGGVEDYSRADSAQHAIQFTDYRLAHTTSRLADESDFEAAARRIERELRSVETLKQHRETDETYRMSAREVAERDARARDREEDERRRLAALDAYDRMVDRVHGRTSRMLEGLR